MKLPLSEETIRIFLCGDVMIGRGIDQILMYPNHPQLYESFISDAREYVFLAETRNGKIPYPVAKDYIWGDALHAWDKFQPHIKIINLETAITKSNQYMVNKGIHYRLHPRNIDVLTTAGIDVCTLANNHILDWGYAGLVETCSVLEEAQIKYSGAGKNIKHAMQPAIFKLSFNKRILTFAAGTVSSGVSSVWNATSKLPGVYYLSEINENVLSAIVDNINHYRNPNDLIIFSIHWGGNWGYEIPTNFRKFAHGLIDSANVDIVFGHSSHHLRAIEVYNGKPILYGCGDFINDYEGISGHEKYRGDLSLMYFLDFESESAKFLKLTLIPLEIKKFRLHYANEEDSQWLLQTLNVASPFTVQFQLEDHTFVYNTAT